MPSPRSTGPVVMMEETRLRLLLLLANTSVAVAIVRHKLLPGDDHNELPVQSSWWINLSCFNVYRTVRQLTTIPSKYQIQVVVSYVGINPSRPVSVLTSSL